MKLAPLAKADLPDALPLRKLLGPSFILLGLGLGSGELILWPYLASNYGLGLVWACVLGITFQFFLNMEIERYTLVTGESVFVGLARKLSTAAPIWFILSTLLPWMWPGIIASAGKLFAAMLGVTYTPFIPIVMLVAIGLILTVGPVLYRTQEVLQRAVILVGVPFVFALALFLARREGWLGLSQGLVGKGEGFWFLPAGIPIATFLGAFAYAGAGGNLNLAQSLYVKEKGYGMGTYSGRITSLLTGKRESIRLEGTTFDLTDINLSRFRLWWKRINIEHAAVFWATGTATMLLLSLLAYTTVFGKAHDITGINFVIHEAGYIKEATAPFIGSLFLLVAGVMLFFTQFSVFGSTSRIMAENLCLASKRFRVEKLPMFFYFFLWLQIAAGIAIFSSGISEPLQLVIIGAVLNAFTMFVYSGLVLWLNLTSLPKALRPSVIRILAVSAAFLFYGAFSIYTIYTNVFA